MSKKQALSIETKYQLLLRVTHLIRDTLDLDEILNHLLDTLHSFVHYDAAGIFVLNRDLVSPHRTPSQQMIVGINSRGFDRPPEMEDPMLLHGQGIIGFVIRTGECVVVPDVRLNPHYVAGRMSTLSEIAVPVMRSGRTIGALNVENDRISAYSARDLESLCFFADTAAVAIEKAILHRQLIEKKRIEVQLQMAREVQAHLLPMESPQLGGWDIAGICIPSHEIGGDYFDYIRLLHDRLGIVVADASGKGIPAALIITAFRTLLRTHAGSESELECLAQDINRFLFESTRPEEFVSAFYAILDPANGCLRYINCGHNPPLLLRAAEPSIRLMAGGPLLGAFDNSNFTTGEARLAPGELLVLYTDGVEESTNASGMEFGTERLAAVVHPVRGLSAHEILQKIVNDTRIFTGEASYGDDFTLMIVKRKQ